MGYFLPNQLEDAGYFAGGNVQSMNPNPGLGFSVADIFGNLGSAVSKIFSGNSSNEASQIQALIAAENQRAAQQQQTLMLFMGAGLLVGLVGLYLVSRKK